MFSDVLLTVDYDRTLTAPDSTVPERNVKAIRWFMENGGAFTVNTGRSLPMAQAFMNKESFSCRKFRWICGKLCMNCWNYSLI